MEIFDCSVVDSVVDDFEPFIGYASPIVGIIDVFHVVGFRCVYFAVDGCELESDIEYRAGWEVRG